MFRLRWGFVGLAAVSCGAVCADLSIERVLKVPEMPVPLERRLFGFNIPWHNFQRGYMAGVDIRPRIIELMAPFKGAFYRYPGGDESNIFDWTSTLGPATSRHEVLTANSGFQSPAFGVDEFLSFVRSVGGVPVYTLNLCGDAAACSSYSGARHASELVSRYGKGLSSDGDDSCRAGSPCRIAYWELGNELDVGRWNWSAAKYASSAREVSRAIHDVEPGAVTIAAMATAPWSSRPRSESARSFNVEVGSQLGSEVDGFAFHAYYDGMTVPAMVGQMDIGVEQLKVSAPTAATDAIYITEHARWPRRPVIGDWLTTWTTTRDLSGALAVGDYLLTIAPKPEVKGAMLHALGAWGPWQLVETPDEGRTLVPSALYWGLRVLREGLQGQLLSDAYVDSDLSAYRAGYAVRAVITKPGQDKVAVVVVNRAARSKSVRIDSGFGVDTGIPATCFRVSGSDPSAHNSAVSPHEVEMQRSTVLVDTVDGDVLLDVPPLSISTYVFSAR